MFLFYFVKFDWIHKNLFFYFEIISYCSWLSCLLTQYRKNVLHICHSTVFFSHKLFLLHIKKNPDNKRKKKPFKMCCWVVWKIDEMLKCWWMKCTATLTRISSSEFLSFAKSFFQKISLKNILQSIF